MYEQGQSPGEISDAPLALLECQNSTDIGRTFREKGKLELRHGSHPRHQIDAYIENRIIANSQATFQRMAQSYRG
jgi:hypothetical protein